MVNPTTQSSQSLTTVATLAGLLERIDRHGVVADAKQYQSLAQRLSEALKEVGPSDGLQAILSASPATATLYENIHYGQAGLCLSTLDCAMRAELETRDCLRRVAN